MTIEIRLVASVCCDYLSGDRGCTETGEYRSRQYQDVASFAYDAQKHFEALGWRFPSAPERCLCPQHARTSQTRG